MFLEFTMAFLFSCVKSGDRGQIPFIHEIVNHQETEKETKDADR